MKVILTKDTPKVGRKYELKEVPSGFALNFLIPQGFASVATDKLIQETEQKRKKDEESRLNRAEELAKESSKISKITVIFTEKVSEKGHLFAGIDAARIVAQVKEQEGIEIDAEFIRLKKAIKEVGVHKVPVVLGDTETNLTVEVVAAE